MQLILRILSLRKHRDATQSILGQKRANKMAFTFSKNRAFQLFSALTGRREIFD